MLVLAVDTATTDLVTGLVNTDTGAATDRVIAGTRGHNETLVPTIIELLAETNTEFAQLGAVVVGHGPGPFTGLRVGMATAQAIAQALGVPVHGVFTHDAIVLRLREQFPTAEELLVATDARRKEIYYATYGVQAHRPDVIAPEKLELGTVPDAIAIPDKLAERLPSDLQGIDHVELSPRAKDLVACADLTAAPTPLTPAYLRRPDAVPPAPLQAWTTLTRGQ